MYELLSDNNFCFLQTSQDLDRVTLASINFFLLIMKF